MFRTRNLSIRLGCILVTLLAMFVMVNAMPPHPDLVARIAQGQQTAPYYLQHESELRAMGVESPTRTRTIAELVNRRLDEEFPVLVILVDFSDHVSHVAGSSFDSLLLGSQTGSLKNFYTQVTYGNLTLVSLNLPGAMGWQRAPQTYAYYVNNQNGTGAYPHNSQKLVEDVVNILNPVVDFSQYDSDGDGTVEGLFILHSGPGAEYTGNNADIWSHAWSTYNAPHVDGVWVRNYSIEPEYWTTYGDMTCGVFAHEMGHAVFGLPDLYDTGYDSNGLGKWSLMAGGSWNGTLGNSPSHPDGWCKVQMGVVTPTVVTGSTTGVSIPAIETTPTIFRLWTNGAAGNQYVLVENRQRTGYDAALPSSGLMIYHVDDAVSGNDHQWYPGQPVSSHYQVALEQADGLWQLEHYTSSGDAGDPYPGSTGNRTYDDTSTPNSQSYTPATTNVAVRNISNSAATMTADLSVSTCVAPAQVTGVSATNNRCSDVQLTWTDLTNETGYRVLRNGNQLGSDLAANVTTYTDNTAVPGTSYSYTVVALSSTCAGPASASVVGVRTTTPVQVSGVTASSDRCGDIRIDWTDVSGESGYRVQRDGSQIGSDLTANATSFVDTTATPGVSYSYRVLAFHGSCIGTISSPANGLRPAAPAQVSGVSASDDRCDSVIVTWTAVAGADYYRVFRDSDDLGVVSGITRFADAPTPGTYAYTVLAQNGCGAGTASAPENGSLIGAAGVPTNVQASETACGSIEISWTAAPGSVNAYLIQRDGMPAATAPANATMYTDSVTGVHQYRVLAMSLACGTGQPSAPDSGRGLAVPAQVTGVTATDSMCTGVRITWNTVADNTGYTVFRGTDSLTSVQPDAYTYLDETAVPGAVTAYQVRAYNACGNGASSAAQNGRRLVMPSQIQHVNATDTQCDSVIITWDPPTDGDSVRILRGDAAIATLPASAVRYADTPLAGAYEYSVLAMNLCGASPAASDSGYRCALSADEAALMPKDFMLEQNFPNPFNPVTEIRFGLPRTSAVSIVIYDMLGRRIGTLVSGGMEAGMHSVVWGCSSCSSGMYLVRMQTADRVLTRKMLLMK